MTPSHAFLEPENNQEKLEQGSPSAQQSFDDFNTKSNLVGFFSLLLAEAKRTNPEKYLEGYKQKI